MYIPLYIKTDYSLLSSLIKIDDLIKKAKEYNLTSLGICDDNLCGVMEFYNKCKDNNIKPIIGLDLAIFDINILLFVKNYSGYQNLIKIESLKNRDNITLESLNELLNDLAVIIPYEYKDKIKDLGLNIDSYYFGIDKDIDDDLDNLVYINKTLYLEKTDYKYLPYLFMIRDNKTIDDGINYIYKDNYFYKDVNSFKNRKALLNTLKIADLCNLSFTYQLHMPKFCDDAKAYLRNLSLKGLKRRLNDNVSSVYLDRLSYELDVITNMNFEDYFLVVYDFIKYAKTNNILVGPGRGSAAGSLVAYSIGITEVDPIKYDLLFERFLNPERVSLPDIDTDFPDDKRDIVIDYVKNKYGSDKVCGIITFGTLLAKQALRDVGRILNISNEDLDYISKNLNPKEKFSDFLNNHNDIKNYIRNNESLVMLEKIVNKIEGNKRHTSSHAAGIVISRDPLDSVIPITYSDDLTMTEFTMEYLEPLGLIKMDFLGIKNLSTIESIIEDINRDHNMHLTFNRIPLNDTNVIFNIFAKGNTLGIFQFESEGMKKFLKEMSPHTLEDIFAAIALYRPGPQENIPSFIKRKKNKEKTEYITSSLKKVLENTHGIIIYQEQIMQIARILAGYTFAEADILRRAMSKKKYNILKQEEERFIKKSIENGYDEEISKSVYDLILKFANYGFNRSHSVSYSIIAYKMAYLKYYYPKYFYSNLLTGVIGSTPKTKEYLQELKRLGTNILNPSINISGDKYINKSDNIYAPLSIIRNIGGVITKVILDERTTPYKDIFDFLIRTYPKTNNIKVITSLIYASCFDSFGYNKKTLIENLENILNYVDFVKQIDNLEIEKPIITIYEEYDTDYLLDKEMELYGFYLTSHKTEKYKLQEDNIIDLIDIKDYLNKRINVVGSVEKVREIMTKNNKPMTFIEIVDNTLSQSLVYFDSTNLKKGDIAKFSGKVEKRYDEYQIIIDTIKVLN